MKTEKFSIKKRINSFKYAFSGLSVLIREEHNARIHLIAAITVIVLGFLLRINSLEWIILVITISLVFAIEAINSAIEALADFVTVQKHFQIKKTKDLAAAAVLIVSMGAIIVGVIIFLPKMLNFFYH
ncbi:MAG: diacylglycerol kinase family protein [Bacteroidales bacterium]|nr:diacylglycerol kinase family protein [Bacteroidales bacterium]